ncbi:MAG: triose-phosphate isomerase [Candidatus Brocadiaceae bacterium]|nr:triose-phosphate isomerase [Candidatus Brocadiaceae bacterium]
MAMIKRPFVIGNWKMNLTLVRGIEFAKLLKDSLHGKDGITCGVCPPFIFLKEICKILEDSNVCVAAQNIHSEKYGAYTGEVSALMIKEVGCTHVLIGHSERRHIFHEDDFFINAKIKTALSVNLKPIFCVGEMLDEREAGRTKDVIRNQLVRGLRDVRADQLKEIVIAYEPVWAIGTGKTALPEQANEVHSFIRNTITNEYDKNLAKSIYILYGGSVKPENAKELADQSEIDGLLVGGASILFESFLKIIEVVSKG